jgi:acetyl-CoA acyltransferase
MAAVREAVARVLGLGPNEVEDVVLGCAMPEGAQGLNVARQVALGAGLQVSTSAMTVNRFRASDLQALALASQAVKSGVHDVVVAGGIESMSVVPASGWHFAPNPGLAERLPQVFLNRGSPPRRWPAERM